MTLDRWISILALTLSALAPIATYKWLNDTELRRRDEGNLRFWSVADMVSVDILDGKGAVDSIGQETMMQMSVYIQHDGKYPITDGVAFEFVVDEPATVEVLGKDPIVEKPIYRTVTTEDGKLLRIAVLKTASIGVRKYTNTVEFRIKPEPPVPPEVAVCTMSGCRTVPKSVVRPPRTK